MVPRCFHPDAAFSRQLSAARSDLCATSAKIIVVYGATGAAGGSVAKYLLRDGTFTVRDVTRKADSPAALALKAQGAEIVVADLDKPETIGLTLTCAYGVSGITDFWTLFPKFNDTAKAQEAEVIQGKTLVDAAQKAGIQHFLWFTLWHCDAPHLESTYQVEQYLKASGLPYTAFLNCWYYENFMKVPRLLKKLDDGSLSFELPYPDTAYMPSYSVDQSGGWAFKKPEQYLGKTIIAIGEHLTPQRYAEVLSSTLGKKVTAAALSFDAFNAMRTSPNPFVAELYLNLRYFTDDCQPPNSAYDVAASRAVYPGQHMFEECVQRNDKLKEFLASF